MLRSFTGIALAAMLLASAPVWAQSPSYDYLEIGFVQVDIDDSSVDGDGFSLGGSYGFRPNYHVFGQFTKADFDLGIDLDELLLGVGYHTSLSPTTDFVGEVSYVRVDAGASGFSADDDGIGLSAGVRSMLNPQLELAGSLNYVLFDEGDNETSLNGEAWYSFTDTVAGGVQVGLGDDVSRFGLRVRLYFD